MEDKEDYSGLPSLIFEILFIIIIFGAFLSCIPLKSSIHQYDLTVMKEYDGKKLSVVEGLCRATETNICILTNDNEGIFSKNFKYLGDIIYVPSDRNTISYEENSGIFGNFLYIDNITITYDKNVFVMD